MGLKKQQRCETRSYLVDLWRQTGVQPLAQGVDQRERYANHSQCSNGLKAVRQAVSGLSLPTGLGGWSVVDLHLDDHVLAGAHRRHDALPGAADCLGTVLHEYHFIVGLPAAEELDVHLALYVHEY